MDIKLGFNHASQAFKPTLLPSTSQSVNSSKLALILTSNLKKSTAIVGSITISASFIFFLYALQVKKVNQQVISNDHPERVKSRSKAVLLASLFSMSLTGCLLDLVIPQELFSVKFLKILGLNPDIKAQLISCFHGLALIGTLFAGPILQILIQDDSPLDILTGLNLKDSPEEFWVTMRTLIIAPITEEFVFRSCIVPLLYKFYKVPTLYFVVPIYFGLAHIHKFYERWSNRLCSWRDNCLMTLFQFFYTTLFGSISTFIYVKTASLPAVILIHMFCNFISFPDFSAVYYEPSKVKKIALSVTYVLGLCGFAYACKNLIHSSTYFNDVF